MGWINLHTFSYEKLLLRDEIQEFIRIFTLPISTTGVRIPSVTQKITVPNNKLGPTTMNFLLRYSIFIKTFKIENRSVL